MRILITGSRNWDDAEHIRKVITFLALEAQYRGEPVTVVHGACHDGADAMADRVANELRLTVERHPADWGRHGRSAGFIRNAEMVKAGADMCVAFIRDASLGATHCADLASKAGVHVWRYTS